ncbi:NAD-dependent epimerase/dehydratase family protein [candidate division KSB1 bacterium]|nr:NAD-dependent epimerase/dehydratase family protein [candidate division KSB1 bacterium]RQW01908.1 MAG: NAD-dependent epimerase/dehydratase family protein [candidate division KSB1 bacterium]
MENESAKLNGRQILITGGMGFIGSNLAHRLVREGARVTIYDACLDPYGWNWANLDGIRDDVQVVIGDVRDEEKLEHHARGKDIIFHLAAQVGREISMASPELDADINCIGTLNLCKVLARGERRAKVVYAGSRGQIGEPVYLPVDEAHPTEPTDVYGINKLAAEKYLLLYGHIFNFPVVSLRLNNVYGPRCQMEHGFYGILNWFIQNAMTGRDITVYGDGMQTRDYIYIDDVVDAFVRAGLSSTANDEIFFIGSGVESHFIDMVRQVIDAVGRGNYVHIPFPPQRECIDIRRFVATFAKFKGATGWQPKIDLAAGVRYTVDYYRDKLDRYLKKS